MLLFEFRTISQSCSIVNQIGFIANTKTMAALLAGKKIQMVIVLSYTHHHFIVGLRFDKLRINKKKKVGEREDEENWE